jgi:hypothetical protein
MLTVSELNGFVAPLQLTITGGDAAAARPLSLQ